MSEELTGERWQRLEELFEAAVELPKEQQDALVDQVAAEDPELGGELSGMLAHASGVGERIGKLVESSARASLPGGIWIGRRFGPYRVLREIGHGGMGLVFEAVRDDDEYRKTVALKVAPGWRDVELLRERFRHERQILAGLEHPNIARFLDGGTDEGIPYFAMEYVNGRSITEYCQGLGLRERIGLFLDVCAAVHYAHDNLVVHRDLKPANVLVGEDGTDAHAQVKLLDFGIAKLLSPMAGGETTATGMLWTPDYASPEQVRGGAITTRTDVYALGLVLYELLSGERAQAADTSTPMALDRSICEREPVRPSERAGDRRLAGDLDTIVGKAIQKEPERRYGSVAALSEDLRRYLEGRPVLARPGTMLYRAGKMVRRHRVGVAAGALVLAIAAAGVVSTVHQAGRAERRFNEVRKLANTFVFEMHDRIATLPGSTEARKALVQTALTYLENLRADAAGDAALSRELAEAYEKIGDVQGDPLASNLGDAKGALSSYRRAEGMLASLSGREDVATQLRLAAVDLKLAKLERFQSDSKAAMEHYARARDTARRLREEEPGNRAVLELLGEIYSETSRAMVDARDLKGADDAARSALEVSGRLVALDAGNRGYRNNLSEAHSGVGGVQVYQGRLEEAAENYRTAVTIREQVVREEPNHTPYRRSLLIGYGNLGEVLGARLGQNLGDTAGAAEAFEKCLAIAESLRRDDPADRRALFDLASVQLRMGSLLVEDPQMVKEGLRRLEEADRITSRLLEEDPKNYRYQLNAMVVNRRMGEGLAALGRNAEAMRKLERSIALGAVLLSGSEGRVARIPMIMAWLRLAMLEARAGDPRAGGLADAAAAEVGRLPKGSTATWNDASMYGDLGRAYRASGRMAEASGWLEKSREAWRSVKAPKALEARRKLEAAGVEAELASVKR